MPLDQTRGSHRSPPRTVKPTADCAGAARSSKGRPKSSPPPDPTDRIRIGSGAARRALGPGHDDLDVLLARDAAAVQGRASSKSLAKDGAPALSKTATAAGWPRRGMM